MSEGAWQTSDQQLRLSDRQQGGVLMCRATTIQENTITYVLRLCTMLCTESIESKHHATHRKR
eukprot:217949-Pelagomonas_calceolata.AAC.4